jgi:uncharacterized repeat protein (TIGR02543 family)
VAVDDAYSTVLNTALVRTSAQLVANDTDVDGNALNVTAVSGATNGTVALAAGNITFTPTTGFTGTAGYDYTVSDGTLTDTGHVTVTVTAGNQPPVAVDDTATTAEDTALVIVASTLKANDTDPDNTNAQLSVTAVSNPTNGTVALASGNITFTPTANFNGTAGFDYTVSDGALTDIGHVTVTVTPVNDAPVAVDDTATTAEDTALVRTSAQLVANDTDPEGNALSVTAVSGATNGTVALAAGNITFTPTANFNGTGGYNYTVSDGALTDTGHVTVTVTAVNDAPVAVDDAYSTVLNTALVRTSAQLVANDTDVDGNALSVTAVSGATNGTVALAAGNITFTPTTGFIGTAGYDYTVSDGTLTDIGHVTVTVTEANHTVTFNANGGSGTMTAQTAGAPTALTSNAFTRTGYSFSGWNTAANGSGTAYANGATYSFAADITLYAQWTALPSHTVSFYKNGGTGSMSPQTANVPTALKLNTFTRTGYTFAGWNTQANGSGTAYADGATYAFAADNALYAQWTVHNHTVTFNANGGSGTMTAQTTNLPTALKLNTFTRSGYNFAGWNTAANGSGTAYADGSTYSFAASITLYAQWTVRPNHTVTFNANGGSGTMTAQTTNIPTALKLNTFTRSRYNFAGWNTAANGSGTAYADGATYSFAASITLYAQWSGLPNHTVTFNANGGTGSMSPQTAPVPTALKPNTFTRSGYTFAGWNTAANGSGTEYADGAIYQFTADATLYAQWTALPTYTIFLPIIHR